jgi:1-acyl-sn-glycerol-3-phosphate acyltransferase
MRGVAALWMRGIHRLLASTVGLRHRLEGVERLPPGPVILAAKHQSAWETLLFHTVRRDVAFGLKQELRRIPIFGWYLRLGGNIFIDRGGAARALRSLIDGAQRAVGEGCSIIIFPEGTRRPPGAPPDYKSGVAALYAALDVPVVPIALDSGRFWPRRGLVKRPGTITVSFLQPIPPGLDRRTFMARLERAIETRTAELLAAADESAALERPALRGQGQPMP